MGDLDLDYDLSENDPMVGQYDEKFIMDDVASSSHVEFHRIDSSNSLQEVLEPYTLKDHAKITLQFFRKIREKNKFNDVTLESCEKTVVAANRLILSAFSTALESSLLGLQNSNSITLNLEKRILGVDAEDILDLVQYMYSGEFKATRKFRKAAEALGCKQLIELLREVLDGETMRDESHAIRFQSKLQVYKSNGWFLDCNILVPSKDPLKCHRLALCAHALNIQEPLIETGMTSQVNLDLDQVSTMDVKNILEFIYHGVVRGGRRRYRQLRAAALDLGVTKLDEMLGGLIMELVEEENMLVGEYVEFPEEVDYRMIHIEDSMGGEVEDDDEEAEYENAEDYQPTIEDVTAQATEDYVSIYEEYVMGPSGGRRGGTYGLNKWNQSLIVKGNTVMTLPETSDKTEEVATETCQVPAILVSYSPNTSKKTKAVDSYGFGLPEYQTISEIEVPLLVGNQKEMLSKPFKCPHCEHRAREKSGIDKHVRSVHTGESPYKCRFCGLRFKVQSNLVRHIRSHTGEKPYACKKCGIAYADKKNMDAHIFREHLKTQMITCTFIGCGKKFWRHDRFSSHCLKVHGALPNGFL